MTDLQGIFEFVGLRPGTYTITEAQPTSIGGVPTNFIDGRETLGEVIEWEPPSPPVVLGVDGVVDPDTIDLVTGLVLNQAKAVAW